MEYLPHALIGGILLALLYVCAKLNEATETLSGIYTKLAILTAPPRD